FTRLLRPPPLSPLFPYTTLFRSVVLLRHSARRLIGAAVEREPPVARAGGEVAPPVAAHGFDRQPLERWPPVRGIPLLPRSDQRRSEEHTSELQSRSDLVCRLLLE